MRTAAMESALLCAPTQDARARRRIQGAVGITGIHVAFGFSLAIIYLDDVAMSQTLLRKQSSVEMQPMPLAFIRRETQYMSVLILRP